MSTKAYFDINCWQLLKASRSQWFLYWRYRQLLVLLRIQFRATVIYALRERSVKTADKCCFLPFTFSRIRNNWTLDLRVHFVSSSWLEMLMVCFLLFACWVLLFEARVWKMSFIALLLSRLEYSVITGHTDHIKFPEHVQEDFLNILEWKLS